MRGNKVLECGSGNREATRDADRIAKRRLVGEMHNEE